MDLIGRQAAIDALWKALYEYEGKTEKQFQESEDLDVGDWILHRIFVQNMSDIDRQAILNLPSAQPERIKGHWIDAVIPNDSGGLPVIVCDKCNTFFPLQFGASHNFCPNCGADMREVTT